ncbi:MAG: hypothetical protein COY66_05890 [Candidatus Kerfeldbacteria bacterium CG_4_10_14_0_8_um_filter_42_10]|uniref:EfeO-type cupredoxin-like domain-containing protein n=1 Tax=Candidatus Kerfeldbacteria bacterium CG_4_10_14_0_8_um_filter_42_10 TaxID=2014248 RepID=A0A2M7RGE8_9BACT|nr:MAG: hypothetical protein COY66_05890 [Candidatus Kerfeldbacteria bacterium CG_4_10_14_0_8_um_filter_42_10]
MSKKLVLLAALLVSFALVLSGCGKKTQTNANTTPINTNTVVTEAPFTLSGITKIFELKLVNGQLNYKTMTFYAGDTIRVSLTNDDQPVDFEFKNVGAKSTSGVFSTSISNTDPGGVYQLGCIDRDCGIITVTVINSNKNININSNANQATNTNTNNTATSSITKAELQRLPAGTTIIPGMSMETTDIFQIGDQYGLNVLGVFKEGDILTHSIVDSNGTEVEPQGPSSNLITGSNGSCCYSLPNLAGSYSVRLYVNGQETLSVPFTVTAE